MKAAGAEWAAQREHYSVEMCLDAICAVGHYTTMCLVLNSLGVQLEHPAPTQP